MDVNDPNEVRNYDDPDVAQSTTDREPVVKGEPSKASLHPLVAALQDYLARYPYITRWTILNDALERTIEIRLVLEKYDREQTQGRDYLKRKVK